MEGQGHYRREYPGKVVTDDQGQYRLPAVAPVDITLTVLAPGYAPHMRTIPAKAGIPAQDVQLATGQPVKLRFVDPDNKPIPAVEIQLQKWNNSDSIENLRNPNHPKLPPTGIPPKADANGVWEWANAPKEPVKGYAWLKGYQLFNFEFTGGTEQAITMKPEHRIIGSVTDASTGKPIDKFHVIPVYEWSPGLFHAGRGESVSGTAGRYSIKVTGAEKTVRLRIEAPGYRTQDGPAFRVGVDQPRPQDFKLVPSPVRTVQLLNPDGSPAAETPITVVTHTEMLMGERRGGDRFLQTDAKGRFSFPDPDCPWGIVASSDAGYLNIEAKADTVDLGAHKLQPWATVRGVFLEDGQPVAGATVWLNPIRARSRFSGLPVYQDDITTTTKSDGSFEFDRVPPRLVNVKVALGPWRDEGYRSGPSVPLELKPGETVTLKLGSEGITLSGQVKLEGNVPKDLNCTYSLNYLVRRDASAVPLQELKDAGFDISKGWSLKWDTARDEGHAYRATLQHWYVKLTADGNFRVSGVPAGEYDLIVKVYEKPEGCLVDPVATTIVPVTVTDADVKAGTLTVPAVRLQVEAIPQVGDTPKLNYLTTAGKASSLAECTGATTVVHFWASYCAPCKKQIPDLKLVQEEAAKKKINFVSVSLDEDDAAWATARTALKLPWPQYRTETSAIPGVSSVPAYWILDAKGQLLAKLFTPAEVDEWLKQQGKE